MSAVTAAAVANATPAAATVKTEDKKNCASIAGTVAAVVGGIALAALSAYAYVKGYLNPVINYSSSLISSAVAFATKSPLHTVAVVVGGVAIVALAVFLGKLATDHFKNKPADKAADAATAPAAAPAPAAADATVVADAAATAAAAATTAADAANAAAPAVVAADAAATAAAAATTAADAAAPAQAPAPAPADAAAK